MDISVVIPLYNEDESLPELYAWIARVMKSKGFTYEVIFVNDGSTDKSWDVIEQLRAENPQNVKGIKFRRNYGKSPALYCGFHKAEGDVVITMDADLQDSPDEIPELYRMIKEDGYDLVSGYKQRAEESEHMHRLSAEAAQEPQRYKVEVSVEEAVPSHEFRFTELACLMVYRFLAYLVEAGVLCQIWYISVHLAIHLDVLHHILAVGFQSAVEVMQIVYSAYLPCRGVEELCRNGLGEGVALRWCS